MKYLVLSLPLLTLLPALAVASPQDPRLVESGDKLIFMDDQGNRASVLRPNMPDQVQEALSQKALAPADWTRLGPFGGDAETVASSPLHSNLVLAGLAPATSFGGLYRTTTSGSYWTEVSSMSGIDVHDVEFLDANTVYAGTTDGVRRSTNAGANWIGLPLGIGLDDEVFEVTLDFFQPNVIWAGVSGDLTGQTQNVLRSGDAGATWIDLTPPGAAGTSCTGIELDPLTPGRVFAIFGGALGGGSAWRSDDDGATWTDISGGLPANPLQDINFYNGRLLVCGGGTLAGQDVGLYRSNDLGASWTAVHDASWPSLRINSIKLDPIVPNTIYVGSSGSGVFRSLTDGVTWTFGVGGTAPLTVHDIHIQKGGSFPIWTASSSAAIWLSADGVTFESASDYIGQVSAMNVAVNPLNEMEFAASYQGLNDGGVYTSLDAGKIWTLEPLFVQRYNDLEFGPDGRLVVISDRGSWGSGEGVYRRDAGVWTKIGPQQPGSMQAEHFTLEIAPDDPNHILVGGSDFGFLSNKYAIWHTADGGATWLKSATGTVEFMDVLDITFLPDGTNMNALAAISPTGSGAINGGILRTTDGGLTWTPSLTGLPPTAKCKDLQIVPSDPLRVYLLDSDKVNGKIYRSLDGGLSWSTNGGPNYLSQIAVDPLHVGQLYIGGYNYPFVRTTWNEGGSSTKFDVGLPSSCKVIDMELIPGPCTKLLIATDNGIFIKDPLSCRLEVDLLQVYLGTGGLQSMVINAGLEHASEYYWVMGSASGTSPGLMLDGHVLPLNVDSWLTWSLAAVNGPLLHSTFGVLDSLGQSTSPALFIPPGSMPSLAGTVLHHAAVIFDLGPSAKINLTTNAQPLTLAP